MNTSHLKVAVIGMGKTGLSAARYLQRLHIACECFDEAAVQLPDDLENVKLHSGTLQTESLLEFSRVIVSPGIDWRHPALIGARKCGVDVHGDLEEFLSHYTGELIAITGTNGKTTATQMIALLMETLPGGCDAGGNIGTPMLDLLTVEQPKRVALELSSFQLERASHIHPHYAVLLNVQPDHADMHSSPESYRAAKVGMFKYMIVGDTAMLPIEEEWQTLAEQLTTNGVKLLRFGVVDAGSAFDEAIVTGILRRGHQAGERDELFWTQDGTRRIIPCQALMVRGYHQQQNIAVAAQVAADFGVSPAVIEEALLSFQGLEHRLEYVGHVAGRDWFNDSKATNPDAAVAALSSFKQVIWICGGLRKDLALDDLIEMAKKHVSFACVIGEDTDAYVAVLEQAGVPFKISKTIEQAVLDAVEQSEDDVLLSPAAASQDQFKHYAERGKSFVTAIRALDHTPKEGGHV